MKRANKRKRFRDQFAIGFLKMRRGAMRLSSNFAYKNTRYFLLVHCPDDARKQPFGWVQHALSLPSPPPPPLLPIKLEQSCRGKVLPVSIFTAMRNAN